MYVYICVWYGFVAIKGARSITETPQIIKLLFLWLHYASWGLGVGILPTSTQGHNAEDLTDLYVKSREKHCLQSTEKNCIVKNKYLNKHLIIF